jgi:hypothetical protein
MSHKKSAVHTEPQGNKDATFVLYSTKQRIPRSMTNNLAPLSWTINAGQQITSAIGLQSVTSLPLGNASDLNTLVGQLTVGSTSTAFQMFLEEMRQQIIMTNASTFTGKVTLYDIVPRRDCYTGSNSSDPATAFNAGLVHELAAGLATDYGVTPNESALFNQMFNIVKKPTVVDLQPGASYTHEVKAYPRRIMNGEILGLTNINGFRGVTVFTMIVLSGMPAHDSTTKTSVSSSGCSLDLVQTHTYKVKALMNNTTFYKRNLNLPTTFAVGPEVVNEELGEAQTGAGLNPNAGVF